MLHKIKASLYISHRRATIIVASTVNTNVDNFTVLWPGPQNTHFSHPFWAGEASAKAPNVREIKFKRNATIHHLVITASTRHAHTHTHRKPHSCPDTDKWKGVGEVLTLGHPPTHLEDQAG